jgi:hypothetical protein
MPITYASARAGTMAESSTDPPVRDRSRRRAELYGTHRAPGPSRARSRSQTLRSHWWARARSRSCHPAVSVDDQLPSKLQPARASLTQFDQRLRRLRRHHSSSLMTGRVGYVRATSVNPAAENIATVPVKMAEPPTRAALRAATSTGCPSTAVAPCSRANSTAALSSAEPTPDRLWRLSTAKQVTHQAPGSSVSTFAKALLPLTRGKSDRGPTLVHPTG